MVYVDSWNCFLRNQSWSKCLNFLSSVGGVVTKTSVFKAQRSLSRQVREHPQGLPTHQPLLPVIPGSLILSLLTQPHLESVICLLWICCCCSVVKLCLTLYDPMDCSTPGFLVLHYLPEFAQIRVHWISNAIQPSHTLLSPYSFAFNLSQHQGLLQWVSFSHQVSKVLELQLQHQSFQWLFRVDFL